MRLPKDPELHWLKGSWREQLRESAVEGLKQEYANGDIDIEELETELDCVFEVTPC